MSRRFYTNNSSSSILTPSQIFGANYFEDWDFGNSGTMSLTGALINSITSVGSNAGVMSSTGTARPALTASLINGYSAATFDGTGNFMQTASTSIYSFLHNATGGAVITVTKNTDANPNSQQIIFSTQSQVQSTGTGVSVSYKDNFGDNNKILTSIGNLALGSIPQINISANNVFTTQQWNSLVSTFDAANATLADRGSMIVNGGTAIKNNTNNGVFGTGVHSTPTIGRRTAAAQLFFKGNIERIIIVNVIPSTLQLTQLNAYLNFYYGTFPI